MMIAKYPHPDDKKQERGLTPFYLKKVNGHYLSAFPIITPLIAAPIYAVPFYLDKLNVTWENLAILGHITGAFIVSLSGLVLLSICKRYLGLEERKAILLTSIYLFGTINFAMLSQAMWQHGTVELFSLLALLFLFQKQWFFMALSLGLAILSRPTAGILLPFFGLLCVQVLAKENSETIFASTKRRVQVFLANSLKFLAKAALGMYLPFAFFSWYTNKFYADISNNGYASQFLTSWLSPFPEGFLGMWLSPSKGILIYSPVLVFSLVGLYLVFKNSNWKKEENFKYIVFGAIFIMHTLILSLWKHWYGGWGFGYRMASDVIPFMVLCIVPFLNSSLFSLTDRSLTITKIFWITFVFSILVQLFGIAFFDGIWHAAYDRGFRNTEWLWSLKDSEFVFNVRRVLVKLGLLKQACEVCL
jgi:hypothetical protein